MTGQAASADDEKSEFSRFVTGLGRGVAGALFLALPMLMTMEMWYLGFYMARERLLLLLLLNIPLLILLAHRIGFEETATWREAIRDAIHAAGLKTPVVCTGGVHNFEMAEKMLADNACDIVGAARQALADPDWTRKMLLGRGGEVRICEYTNYCEGLDQKHKSVTCQLWDKEGLDSKDVKRTSDKKRRTIAPLWQE